MKLEVTLDETKEKELFDIINKRLDGMKLSKMDLKTKKSLVQSIANKALSKENILASTLNGMGNGEFFELIKNC
jgi:thymidine phosphorylase